VTGGGRGIGRASAQRLAEAAADLYVASRKQANCEAVAGDIRAHGRRAVAVEADLGSPDSIEALADRVLGEAGRLHVLVNNAAIVWAAPTLEYPMTGWDKVFNVNVRGLWQLSQRVARHMAERGGGSIIHVSSDNAYQGDFEERQNIISVPSLSSTTPGSCKPP
jgi:gluconate 5-dehydrogenase